MRKSQKNQENFERKIKNKIYFSSSFQRMYLYLFDQLLA